jgi:hypothetical protein
VVLDRAHVDRLRAKGLNIRESPLDPGRHDVTFETDTDILLHRLRGLDLAGATRVSLRVSVESDDRTLVELPQVPFDEPSGEILVACQRHFSAFPPDTQMEVRVESPRGTRVERYAIMHHFAF